MEKLFRVADYQLVSFNSDADIYVINTCVVTNMGQKKSRQIIHRAIRKNPEALIVVTGCYPQTAAEEVKAIEGVDLILGNQDRGKIVELVEEALHVQRVDTADGVRKLTASTKFEELSADEETNKTRAFFKIQEGCNQFCTYCIIPYARGPLRSRRLENITEEVTKLVDAGFKEVVLIGIHLGAYGHELQDGTNLTKAVQAALAVKGLRRLRLGSLESVEVEDDLLDLIEADKRVCRQLHLPLQSGSDEVLARMHRPYTTQKFSELLTRIRSRICDIAITTDVIVGFPGETEESFAETKRFISECGFMKTHIFPFSPRKGTPAATYDGVVPENIKQERANELSMLDRINHENFAKKMLNKTVEVLFEQEYQAGIVEGLSDNYLRVFVSGSKELLVGKIFSVKITGIHAEGVIGELIS